MQCKIRTVTHFYIQKYSISIAVYTNKQFDLHSVHSIQYIHMHHVNTDIAQHFLEHNCVLQLHLTVLLRS